MSGEFSCRYTDPLHIVTKTIVTKKKYKEPGHSTVLLLDPNLSGEFFCRYTDLLHIVTITGAKILMHFGPRGGLHNKLYIFILFVLP